MTRWFNALKNDHIIERGRVPKGIYFVVEGRVEAVYPRKGKEAKVISYQKGQDFGDFCLFRERSRLNFKYITTIF